MAGKENTTVEVAFKPIPYIHKRTKKRYLMLAVAEDKSDGKEGQRKVLYVSDEPTQPHERVPGGPYVRDEKEFNEKFERNE
jgi:hypothetical protein